MKHIGWLMALCLTCLTSVSAAQRPKFERQNVATRHISGFEVGSIEWAGDLGGCTIDTTIVHSGAQSLKPPTSGTGNVSADPKQNLGGITECYYRFYIYVDTMPSSGSRTIFRMQDSASGNFVTTVDLEDTGNININARIGSAIVIGTINTGAWHCIEGHVVTNAVTGSISGRVDGGTIVSSTGRDTGTGLGTYSLGKMTSGDGVFYLDDFHLNDTTGSLNNSWPGPGGCYLLLPDGDSGTNNWTPSTGSSHFAMVDDLDSTDYLVTTSGTLNLEDRWTVQDLSNFISASSLVTAIQGGTYGQGFGSGPSRDTKLRFRDGSGNTLDGITFTWTTAFADWIYPFTTAEQTWEGSPVPLTVSYVDGMLLSAIDANSNTREIRWYGVWLTVEVIEPVPGLVPWSGVPYPVLNQ